MLFISYQKEKSNFDFPSAARWQRHRLTLKVMHCERDSAVEGAAGCVETFLFYRKSENEFADKTIIKMREAQQVAEKYLEIAYAQGEGKFEIEKRK